MDLNKVLDTPLTIKAAEFQKVANYSLSENIDGWDKEIIKIIHEDLPFVTNYNYVIDFKKLDKKFGYSVGSIKFADIKDVYIPIIIKKYRMSPLDVIVSGDKSMPLNEQTFDTIIANKTKIGELRDPKHSQPFLERQNTQAYEEVHYPVSKYGCLSVSNGDSSILRKIANDNPDYLLHYRNNKTMDILKTALNVEKKPEKKPDQEEKQEAKEITDVDSSIYTSADKTGTYKVATLNNVFHDGVLLTNIYDLDLEKQAHNLFIGNDSYGFQEKYAGCPGDMIRSKGKGRGLGRGKGKGPIGIPIKEKLDAIEKDAGVGDTVTFMAMRNNGCIATVPIKIASKINVDGYEKISGHTVIGDPVDIYLTPKIRTITKTAENVYHIPTSKMQMVKIGNFKRFHWNPDVVKNQTIGKYADNTTKIVKNGNLFSIENDYIKHAQALRPSEAYEALSSYYSNAIDMVKKASEKDSTLFTGIKLAEVKKDEKVDLGHNFEDLFKIAANLTDPDSVDAVLSLGYINETNIQNYVKLIPNLEEVVNRLAKLLLSIRLGLKCDEYSVKQSMGQIQDTIDNLKKFRK